MCEVSEGVVLDYDAEGNLVGIDMRNLSIENVKNVVIYPDKETKINRPGRHGGKVHAFEKTVDGVTLKVVAEIKGSECWLMTAYELG